MADRSASCTRWRRRLRRRSGTALWRRRRAASGSSSAPGTAQVLAGTVSLLLDCPPNQPHRAEIAKMMTRVSHRGRGVATALMRTAEHIAVARGRTLLTLDTAAEEGASGLYEKLGFTLAGIIPDYALKPHGGLTGDDVLLEADRREGERRGSFLSAARGSCAASATTSTT